MTGNDRALFFDPLQLIMGKTRHKNPRTALRYVKPGAEAIAKVTEALAPRRRTH